MADDAEPEPAQLIVNQYQLGRVLGEGAFGEVREGKTQGGDVFAVKCLSKSFLKKKRDFHREGRRMKVKTALDDVQKEIAIMKRAKHPNLVGLIEVIDNEETDSLYLVLEFVAGGQVMYFNGKAKRYSTADGGLFDEARAKALCRDLVEGLRYLHKQGIIHRDLKPENLLLTDEGLCKLADFGVAQKMELEATNKRFSIGKMQGTHQFMSPEMISESRYDGFKVDVWATGVCLYAFVSGKVPFWGDSAEAVFDAITNDPLQLPEGISPALQASLSALLDKDPETRATLDDVLKDDWFEFDNVGAVEVIEISEQDRLNAITPFTLDLWTVFTTKKLAKAWKKKASERAFAASAKNVADGSAASLAASPPSSPSTPEVPAAEEKASEADVKVALADPVAAASAAAVPASPKAASPKAASPVAATAAAANAAAPAAAPKADNAGCCVIA